MTREHDKRERARLSIRAHHLDCKALHVGGNQDQCNCGVLIFPINDDYYRVSYFDDYVSKRA